MTIHHGTAEEYNLEFQGNDSLLARISTSVLGLFTRADEAEVREGPVLEAPVRSGGRRDFKLFDSSILRDRIVLVVESRDGELYPALRSLGRPAADLRRICSFAQAAHMVWDEVEADYLIVVDIDVFDTMSEAVETLRLFRLTHPLTTVVIASAYFARHDLSSERRVIADASVRVPSGRVGIALAIASAIENNRDAARLV